MKFFDESKTSYYTGVRFVVHETKVRIFYEYLKAFIFLKF